eukprot:6455382-Amphidinium_carterae.1
MALVCGMRCPDQQADTPTIDQSWHDGGNSAVMVATWNQIGQARVGFDVVCQPSDSWNGEEELTEMCNLLLHLITSFVLAVL